MKKLISMVILIIIGSSLGYLFGKYGLSSLPKNLPKVYIIGLICSIVPVYFFVVGWHELGHAFVGKMVKFDFRMYIIGPLFFEKENNGWKLKWNKNLNLSGGMVVCVPTSEINLKQRFIYYAAGGPLASLILAVGLYIFYLFLPENYTNQTYSFFRHLLIISSFFSFLIFLITAIPFKSGSFYSDGGRIKRLLKNDETSEMEVLFLKIMSNSNAGVRYKNLNINDLEKAYKLALKLNDSFKVYLLSYLFHSAFDKNENDKAEEYLNLYLQNIHEIPEAFQGMAWLDACFFYAFAKKDIQKANEFWLNFKPGAFIPKAQIYATEAVLAHLNQDFEKAKTSKTKAFSEMSNMMDKGMAASLIERLKMI